VGVARAAVAVGVGVEADWAVGPVGARRTPRPGSRPDARHHPGRLVEAVDRALPGRARRPPVIVAGRRGRRVRDASNAGRARCVTGPAGRARRSSRHPGPATNCHARGAVCELDIYL
jgi:hypothetical protein